MFAAKILTQQITILLENGTLVISLLNFQAFLSVSSVRDLN